MSKVRALYDFWGQNSAELSFQAGEIISLISQEDPGWWEGELHGNRGLFPSNYVEILVGTGITSNNNFSFIGTNSGAVVPTHVQHSVIGINTGFNNPAATQALTEEEMRAVQEMQATLFEQLKSQGIDTSPLFDPNMLMQQATQDLMAQNVNIAALPIANYNVGYSDSYDYNELNENAEGQQSNTDTTNKKRKNKKVKDKMAGEGFKLSTRNLGPGFRWISFFGLMGSLLALLAGCVAIILCANQDPNKKPMIPHLIDWNFTQYVGLYTILAGLFTVVLEYFHIRVGQNSDCPMNSRAVLYLFLSFYMLLSYHTLIVAFYYMLILAPLQIYYDRTNSPHGWVKLDTSR